jgi:hypothetical protein
VTRSEIGLVENAKIICFVLTLVEMLHSADNNQLAMFFRITKRFFCIPLSNCLLADNVQQVLQCQTIQIHTDAPEHSDATENEKM